MKLSIEDIQQSKTVYLPILNIFDVNIIRNIDSELLLENLYVCEIESNKSIYLREIGLYEVHI